MNQQYDLTIQRQLNNRMSVEVGYIGRHMTHEFQPININTVPYMMTLGGQRFDNAYGQMVLAILRRQRWYGGGNCGGPTVAVSRRNRTTLLRGALVNRLTAPVSRTALRLSHPKKAANIPAANVWSLWSDLDNGCLQLPPLDDEHTLPGRILESSGAVDVRRSREHEPRLWKLQRHVLVLQDVDLAWPYLAVQLHLVQGVGHGVASPGHQSILGQRSLRSRPKLRLPALGS